MEKKLRHFYLDIRFEMCLMCLIEVVLSLDMIGKGFSSATIR